jgi:protein-tyrosine phosphatase
LGFFDLHSHVLPGLDDGATDVDTSVAMMRGLADLGFDAVCATPHQRAGMFLPASDAIAGAHRQAAGAAANFGLTLHLGAENMWDAVFYQRSQERAVPSYRPAADASSDGAFLLELPIAEALPVGLFEHLFQIQLSGRLPVIAHPERYPGLWKNWDAVDQLAKTCALVVDLGAIAGYHGRRQGKMARKLLTEGIAHAVASDAHTVNDVRVAAEGIAWIRKKLGQDAVTRLLDENPRSIYAAEHPA